MVKAFFRLRKANDKTPQIIYIGLRYGLDQLIISTGIKVLPKHWDFEKSRIKQKIALPEISLPPQLLDKIKDSDVISFVNNYLTDLAEYVNKNAHLEKEVLKSRIDVYLNGKNEVEQFAFDLNELVSSLIVKAREEKKPLSKETLIKEIETFLHPPVNGVTLFDYIRTFITNVESGQKLTVDMRTYSHKTVQRFKASFALLEEFSKVCFRDVDFDTIDIEFYKEFSSFMANEKNYRPATMGKHIRTLKTFLNEATEEGINKTLDYQKKSFKVVSKNDDETANIALTEPELDEMFNLDLFDNQRLDRVRDLFLIGANTGLRFSDFTDIKPENIREDKDGAFLEIIQYKTKRTAIIPINETVKYILNKYNNQLPEPISNQKFNEYIKEVANLCPLLHKLELLSYVKGGKNIEENIERWTLVSSHTARRSFATNAYERGTPVKSIMAITDHKTEDSFRRYIKTSKRKQAEIFREYQK